jgi:predicted PurR-regulated permease PerM
VILIGAIGGMILSGLLGLFIGPVILAIVHRLYTNWVNDTELA